jgi:ABC-type lipoprotein release transport system permease subunit
LTGVTVFFPEILGMEQVARAIDTRRGAPILTVLDGTAPRGPDEIVMGRASMRRLGLRIGDDVPVTMDEATVTYRLVGRAAFPIGDSAYDDGVAVTIDGARRLPGFAASNHIYLVTLSWVDGIDRTAASAGLVADGFQAHTEPPRPPVVTNLAQIRPVLTLLALFFGLLGLTAVTYMLAVSQGARRRQFAVLTALGMEPWRRLATTGWHAVTLGVIAVMIGVPAGIVAGRVLWATIARRAGVVIEHSLAIGSLTAAVAIAIVGPLAIGLGLAISKGRHPPAESLRAD